MNQGGAEKKRATSGDAGKLSVPEADSDQGVAEQSGTECPVRRVLRSWQWLLWVLVLTLIASATAAANLHLRKSSEFSLENILVEGCEKLEPAFIRSLSGAQSGTNLMVLDTWFVSKRVERCPLIESATVIKQFPRSLLIRVRERRPAALVLARGAFVCLDAEGVVCDRVRSGKPPDLPLLTGMEDYAWTFGKRELGRGVQSALSLMAELSRSAVVGQLSEIHVDLEAGLSFYLENLPVQVRIGWEPFTAGIRRLERVLPCLRAGPDRILSVDVRFARHVYVREEEAVPAAKVAASRGGSPAPGNKARCAGQAPSRKQPRDSASLKATRKTSFLSGSRSRCLRGSGRPVSLAGPEHPVPQCGRSRNLAAVRVPLGSAPDLFPATC